MRNLPLSFVMVSIVAVGIAAAQPPQMINYQGLLTDNAGSPVADGDYSLTFRIFDAETGGTELWSETQPSVAVSGGLFKVQLGSVTALTLAFDAPYWLEVQVGGGQPQFPRIEFASVPYSFSSTDADQVDGFDASATPSANTLLALDGTGQFPASAIPSVPPSGPAGGDLTGTYPDPTIAANAVTAPKIAPDVISSIDGVSNDAGDIDLVAGANVTITPDDAANTITIDAAGAGGGDITSVWPADATLTGGADQGDVTLAVAVPLELEGTVDGVIKGTHTNGPFGYLGSSDYGVFAVNGGNYGFLGGSAYGAWGWNGAGTYGFLGSNDYGAYAYNYNSGNSGGLGGSLYGAYGKDTNSGAYGYLGGGGWGAYGQSPNGNWGTLGTNASGAFGSNSSGGTHGVLGDSDYGVYGAASDDTYGFVGWDDYYGVYGTSVFIGTVGVGDDGGVYGGGTNRGVSGWSSSGWGVRGYTDTGYAGYFQGDVYVVGYINKSACSFVIDHPLDPENKLLRHTSVESPENLVIYRGTVHLSGAGEAVVEMPDYFEALTREDEATVTLTPIGRPFLTGYEWRSDYASFTAYGEPDREVSWVVYADRDDPVMRDLARPVEEEKGPDNKLCDRGELLYPTAYGYPESVRPGYEEDQEELRVLELQRAANRKRIQEHARKTEAQERRDRMESSHLR